MACTARCGWRWPVTAAARGRRDQFIAAPCGGTRGLSAVGGSAGLNRSASEPFSRPPSAGSGRRPEIRGQKRWLLAVNLRGVITGSREFGRQMVERGVGGHIVNVSSAAAFHPHPRPRLYSAAKAGC